MLYGVHIKKSWITKEISGSGGFTVSQNTEDPNNIPWVPYKMKLVATEIFPHFIKKPLATTNDIRLYIEASTIHYGTDTIPLIRLLDDDKRLPEDILGAIILFLERKKLLFD